MRVLQLLAPSLLATVAMAKQCINITVPVTLSARNGVFNLPTLETNFDATTFAQNFTSNKGNYTQEALLGYQTINKTVDISAKFCQPNVSNGTKPVVQFLTHGIGFDKTYWDLPFNNFNYSYIDVAVDKYGFCTLSIDRLGIGNSSIGDPISEIQAPAEISAIYELLKMLRAGTLPNVPQAFSKIVSVGHSFGSAQSYALSAMYPNATDGLILTGFSLNGTYLDATIASWDQKLARLNQPLRFGNVSHAAVVQGLSALGRLNINATQAYADLSAFGITLQELISVVQSTDLADFAAGLDVHDLPQAQDLPTGYLTWVDVGSNQYAFFYPPYFDPSILTFSESTKYPYTLGELLTLGSAPAASPNFEGPVMVLIGDQDAIYCGGDCLQTNGTNLTSIPQAVGKAFPKASAFEAYIQPNTGHGINLHYNSTGAYNVIQQFLYGHGLAPS